MTVSTTTTTARPSFGWLRSARFDLTLIFGVTAIALVSGAVVVVWPHLFPLVLFLDLWLLGYHHVVSTYTRLVFDRESFKSHRVLVLGLPWLVVAGVLVAAWLSGGWILSTTYLYWQWFHYTRQSYGIERAYRRRATTAVVGDERLARWALYLLPLWGIIHRSVQAPAEFLGVELRVIPIPAPVETVAAAAAVAALALWAGPVIRQWWRGERLQAHTCYVAMHCVIFAVGYLVLPSIDDGWLVVNVWHNAQYILFVWMFNNQRFREGVSPTARLLSYLSQRSNWPLYAIFCLLLSSALYFGLDRAVSAFDARVALPVFLIVYQAINFHHYVVDGLIWKMRSKPLRKTLGLESAS